MSNKVGQALVARGLLTPSQLNEALQAQLISGGHLDTSLIDLGYVSEADLGEILAEVFRVRHADLEILRNVPEEVIRVLPPALAEKHQAVPIKVEDRTLHLAAADPRRLGALSSTTGYKVVPWVAPEVRIMEALETYYAIPRRPRHLRLCRELDQKIARRKRELVGAAAGASPDSSRTAAAPDPDAHHETQTEFGYGQDWRMIAEQMGETPEPDDQATVGKRDDRRAPDRSPGAAKRSASNSRRFQDILDRLCRADHNQELSEAVLDYSSQKMKTCMLFRVRSQLARVWDSRGLKLSSDEIRELKFPVTGGSIFALLLGNSEYRGPVPDDPGCRRFFETLDMTIPVEVLLYPVYVNDRLVAIFYGDGGPDEPIEGDTDNHRRLGEKLTLALNMLILKMKIRAV